MTWVREFKEVFAFAFLECHDDTLQCSLWARHGHCKGIAYAEFMKRRCKATCGYCGKGLLVEKIENFLA